MFDYRSRRPVLDVQDGRLSELRWPELTIGHARIERRDVLIFSGAEPDLRWQELAADAVALVRHLNVAAVGQPRRRPGSRRAHPAGACDGHRLRGGLLHPGESPGPEGLLRVPSAALSVLEIAVTGQGTPGVGFYAQVPPYASIGYAAASIALLDRLSRHLDVSFDLESLLAEEREQRARYDDAVSGDAMLRETVARLESATGDLEDEHLPSGDDLAREIERFLRRRDDGEKRVNPPRCRQAGTGGAGEELDRVERDRLGAQEHVEGDRPAGRAGLRRRIREHRERHRDLVGHGHADARIRVWDSLREHRTDPLLDAHGRGPGQIRDRGEAKSRRGRHTAMLSYRGEVCRTIGSDLE